MAKPLLPWKLRGSDFSTPNWHTRPTIGYEFMFEYLRLSPSYELARKSQKEGLTAADKAALPPDFDVVLQTYRLLGDVQNTLFRSWWLRRGLKVFGNPFARPRLHAVAPLMGYAETDTLRGMGFRQSRRLMHAYLTVWDRASAPESLSSLYLDVY